MVDNFEDVLEPIKSDEIEGHLSEDTPPPPNFDPISFIDLLESESGLGEISNKLNPEMKSQVLIPLANLLDKYGFSEKIGSNPTAQSAVNIVGLLNDIAPVIKGLSDYVSGQRNALSAEDQTFLDEIAKAQSSGEFSDLFSGESDLIEIGESESNEPVKSIGTGFDDPPIDWYEMLGATNPEKKAETERQQQQEALFGDVKPQKEKTVNSDDFIESTKVSLPGLEELAMAAGVSMDKVQQADTYINPQSEDSDGEIIEHEIVNILEDDIGLEILEEAIKANESINFLENEVVDENDEEE